MNKQNMKNMPKGGNNGKPPMRRMNFAVLGRVLKMLFKSYPVLIPIMMVCIISSAFVSAIPSIFTQKVMAVITTYLDSGNTDWSAAKAELLPLLGILVALYIISLIFIAVQTQLGAYITQGFLAKMRKNMFEGMQDLPIKYFDTNKHGDIMSYYTNDIDTLRQLISQSLPQQAKPR